MRTYIAVVTGSFASPGAPPSAQVFRLDPEQRAYTLAGVPGNNWPTRVPDAVARADAHEAGTAAVQGWLKEVPEGVRKAADAILERGPQGNPLADEATVLAAFIKELAGHSS